MWDLYTYEIGIASPSGEWHHTLVGNGDFSRDPEDIARALLESWIIDNHGRLPGGRVFTYSRHLQSDPIDIAASVRVRVWRGRSREGEPAGAAYLGQRIGRHPRRSRFIRHLLPRPRTNGSAPGDDLPLDAGLHLVDDDRTGVRRGRRRRRRMAA